MGADGSAARRQVRLPVWLLVYFTHAGQRPAAVGYRQPQPTPGKTLRAHNPQRNDGRLDCLSHLPTPERPG